MRKLLPLITACLLLTSSSGCGGEQSDQLISVGSHRLQVRVERTGTPPIILEAGLGDTLDRLQPLQQRLARVTRVIAYNRAGYGQSEPGPLPRHSGQEADELKTLLDEMELVGPFVVVGHSLGALNLQLFASKYPEEVAGLVLLDPPPMSFIMGRDYPDLRVMADQMTAEWQAIADATSSSSDPQERAQSAFLAMIASEHRELFGESARRVDSISDLGNLPLVVIAAGRPNPAFGEVADEYQRYWIEQSRELADRSTRSRFTVAESSGHHLYLDVPDLVAESILWVVSEVRADQ
jgi:pimeloyl-ACP methyl ester carboxylesterase